MVKEWTRTVVHTEDYKKSRITVTHYTNGIVKGSFSYDIHSKCFPHHDSISAGRGSSINDCIVKAKQAHYSFWGPLGERRL